MNNELKIFKNEEFGEIRTVTIDNEPWFVASDICKALDIKNVTQAVQKLDDDERSMFNIGRQGNANCVNEYGLYSLVLSSRKKEAKDFKRWITHEIIPSIRKHGGYIAGQETLSDDELLAKAVLVAQSKIAEKDKIIEKQKTTIIEQNKTIEQQNERLQMQKPFVQAAMKLQRANNTVSMGTTSKALKGDGIDVGRNELFAILREHKILINNNSPYQKYMDLGLFEVKIETKENHYRKTKLIPVTRVTGKGLIFLNKKLREWLEIESLDIDI